MAEGGRRGGGLGWPPGGADPARPSRCCRDNRVHEHPPGVRELADRRLGADVGERRRPVALHAVQRCCHGALQHGGECCLSDLCPGQRRTGRTRRLLTRASFPALLRARLSGASSSTFPTTRGRAFRWSGWVIRTHRLSQAGPGRCEWPVESAGTRYGCGVQDSPRGAGGTGDVTAGVGCELTGSLNAHPDQAHQDERGLGRTSRRGRQGAEGPTGPTGASLAGAGSRGCTDVIPVGFLRDEKRAGHHRRRLYPQLYALFGAARRSAREVPVRRGRDPRGPFG